MFFLARILALTTVIGLMTLPAHAQRPREIWERYTVAFIGKDGGNPLFGATRMGARDAAQKLDHKYNLEIKLLFLTPPNFDPQAQSKALDQAFVDGADGVILSVTDPAIMAPQIDFLKEQGIPTVTFDSDAPGSSRIATIQTDNAAVGRVAFEQATKNLPFRKGSLAILAGQQQSDNLRQRLEAIQAAAAENDRVEIIRVFECPETVDGSIEVVRNAFASDRDEDIDGWIFLGGWPLMGVAPMPWEPGERVCVSVDALPPMLAYMQRRQVDALIAQHYYRWGYLAMETLIEYIHLKQAPAEEIIFTKTELITQDNFSDYSRSWADWMQ